MPRCRSMTMSAVALGSRSRAVMAGFRSRSGGLLIRKVPAPVSPGRAERREELVELSAGTDPVTRLADHEVGAMVTVDVGERQRVAHQVLSMGPHHHPQRLA